MSQAVPLTKLLAHSNKVVEAFQHRMQEDNMNHIDDMLSVYSHALEGGATPKNLNHIEKSIANRDNFNEYRMAKDATEWMAVDKKMYSYLGRDMNILAGGIHDMVPYNKEPNMVQALRLNNAFIDTLSQKMMHSRSASLRELEASINVLKNDPQVPETVRTVLTHLLKFAHEVYDAKLERDAQELMLLEMSTTDSLAPSTAACITKCGVKKQTREFVVDSEGRSAEEGSSPLKGGCGDKWLKGGHGEKRKSGMKGGQNRVHDSSEWLDSVANDWLSSSSSSLEGGEHKPKFRSPAAAQLYNLISTN
jgi:hypothetical protein